MERRTSVADTGFVVALLNSSDPQHKTVVQIYAKQRSILLPQTVFAEVAYLVSRNASTSKLIDFLRGLSESRFQIEALQAQDFLRVADILEEYTDSRIDFVDATVMAIAERYKITVILTLDRRDFSLFRPRHCDAFQLLP
ncbi:MAG: PIN domain-containing protein [Cyanobacteria bacterium P01_E01_bin.42]